jgi:hypothetical protein
VTEYNEERGPNLYDLGSALLDPRPAYNYSPGDAVGSRIAGIYGQVGLVDYIPYAANSSAIVGSTVAPVAGTPLTLAANSTSGTFLTTITAPESGLTVSVIAIDSTAMVLSFGQAGSVGLWNPAGGTGRSISVLNGSNANTEQYIVNGRDMYGFKMTETILASTTSSGTGVGKKAFKYLVSVTPSTATTISATGVRVGFQDVFGFPLLATNLANTVVTVSTTFLAPSLVVLTSANATIGSSLAMTATTPDVRGTYAASAAFVSNGTSATIANGTGVRLTIRQQITAQSAASVGSSDVAASPLFGFAQFSNF